MEDEISWEPQTIMPAFMLWLILQMMIFPALLLPTCTVECSGGT